MALAGEAVTLRHAPSTEERTRENAPKIIYDQGGLALSLWMTGTNETDCVSTARLKLRCERYRGALERIESHGAGEAVRIAREALS